MTPQQPIRISYLSPSSDQASFEDYFTDVLSKRFPIELVSPEEAQYVFCSDPGVTSMHCKAVKIYYTGENRQADWTAYDYGMSHELDAHPRHLRVPYYALFTLNTSDAEWDRLLTRQAWTVADLHERKSKFCHFVYRNHVCKTRNRFFKKLSEYKRVDSAGPFLNNMDQGYCVPRGFMNTLSFMNPYKFSISFENEAYRGYTTEKLFNALIARTVPIYWGNPEVARDFNPKSFINYYDFSSEKELLDYVIHVDENDELYLKYLNAPMLNHPRDMIQIRDDFYAFFERIFSNTECQRSASELRHYTFKKYLGRYAFARLKAWKRRYTKRQK